MRGIAARSPNVHSVCLFGLLVGAGGLVVWQQLGGHPIFPPPPNAASDRAAAAKRDAATHIVPATVVLLEGIAAAPNGAPPEVRVPEHWEQRWFNGQRYYIIPCDAPRDAPCD